MHAKSIQSCPILCDPMDYSPSGSSVHGILQARILESVAIPFSKGSSQPKDQTQVSCTASRLFTIWATSEAREHWSGSLSLLSRIFLTQRLNPGLRTSGILFTIWTIREAYQGPVVLGTGKVKVLCCYFYLVFFGLILLWFCFLTWRHSNMFANKGSSHQKLSPSQSISHVDFQLLFRGWY